MSIPSSQSPLENVRVQAEKLNLEGIQKNLHKVTNKEASWRGHVFKNIKESINNLINDLKEGLRLSPKTDINEKFRKNLPELAKDVGSLVLALEIARKELGREGQNDYSVNLIVKDRVDKAERLLEKIKQSKVMSLDEKNLKEINKLQKNLVAISDDCDRNLQVSTKRMDDNLETKRIESNPELKTEKEQKTKEAAKAIARNLEETAEKIREELLQLKKWINKDSTLTHIQKNANPLDPSILSSQELQTAFVSFRDEINSLLDITKANNLNVRNKAEKIVEKTGEWVNKTGIKIGTLDNIEKLNDNIQNFDKLLDDLKKL